MIRSKASVNFGLMTVVLALATATLSAEPLPAALKGSWRITRILPTKNVACWGQDQAAKLLGSTLTYADDTMRWQGGSVPLQGIITRQITVDEFAAENSGSSTNTLNFDMVGIHGPTVTEIDLQHEDADITGATTEVPGDAVLLSSPTRIVVSACGVYYEATRATPPPAKKKPRR